MNDEEKYWMGQAMETFGGSFVKALKRCMECADMYNLERLFTAFPEIVTKYREMGMTLKERHEKEK